MNYLLLFVLMLTHPGPAQSTLPGLGKYIIGTTTPDSLSRTAFTEADQSYVKGTIALPCSHIRAFTAATETIAGVSLTNVVLVFYDNTLFKISCDYSDSVRVAFLDRYGPGVRTPVSRVQLCTKETGKPLLLWGERWLGGDRLALVVHRKGYTADCNPEEGARLTVVSQRMLALSSDCDLKPADPFLEEFMKAGTSNPAQR